MVNQESKYRKPVSGNKSERATTATQWLETLDTKYKEETNIAVEHSFYSELRESDILDDILDSPIVRKYDNTVNRVFCNDVVTCAKAAVTHAEKDKKICVLNFASYTTPGGGFLKGSTAQEEALCYATGLYPCLEKFKDKYEEHRHEETDGCYSHDYIYSQNVPFIVNGKCYFIDVLTMAAPNQKASKFSPVEDIFAERMELAFKIPAIYYGVDIILLGAWGCGAFGNDPDFVAAQWKAITEKYNGLYKEVVHPVLDGRMCQTFKEVILGQKRKAQTPKRNRKR